MIPSWRKLSWKSILSTVPLFFALSLPIGFAPWADAASKGIVTQGEFATYLVQALGWESGLPPEPKTADYLTLLSGERTLKFEAEEVFNHEGDSVTVRDYPLYGPFSGKGWLSGTAMATRVRFSIFVPREGEYLVKVASRGDGQLWLAGGREFKVSTGGKLREAELGTVFLKAGIQEISVLLPPEGGVDFLLLETAGGHVAIEPLDGWRPDSHLTWGEYAETLAAVLGIEKELPPADGSRARIVAAHSAGRLPSTVFTTTADYLGSHLASKWVRAGVGGAHLELPIEVESSGVYGIRVRLMGEVLSLDFNGKRLKLKGKPYLDWYDLGVHRLKKGTHLLKVELPPMGGIDVLELLPRNSSPEAYLAAMGLKGKDPRGKVSHDELEVGLRKDLGSHRQTK